MAKAMIVASDRAMRRCGYCVYARRREDASAEAGL